MEQQKEALPPCHQIPSSGNDVDCCDDHNLVFEHSEASVATKAKLLTKTLDLKFVAAFKVVILKLFAPEAEQESTYALYTSPPLARDIPVLVQSFLL